jgi:hypothetical protein
MLTSALHDYISLPPDPRTPCSHHPSALRVAAVRGNFGLDGRFRFDQVVCPGCGRSLWIDVQRTDAPRARDLYLRWPE